MVVGRWFVRCDIEREVGKGVVGFGVLAMDGSLGCGFWIDLIPHAV